MCLQTAQVHNKKNNKTSEREIWTLEENYYCMLLSSWSSSAVLIWYSVSRVKLMIFYMRFVICMFWGLGVNWFLEFFVWFFVYWGGYQFSYEFNIYVCIILTCGLYRISHNKCEYNLSVSNVHVHFSARKTFPLSNHFSSYTTKQMWPCEPDWDVVVYPHNWSVPRELLLHISEHIIFSGVAILKQMKLATFRNFTNTILGIMTRCTAANYFLWRDDDTNDDNNNNKLIYEGPYGRNFSSRRAVCNGLYMSRLPMLLQYIWAVYTTTENLVWRGVWSATMHLHSP